MPLPISSGPQQFVALPIRSSALTLRSNSLPLRSSAVASQLHSLPVRSNAFASQFSSLPARSNAFAPQSCSLPSHIISGPVPFIAHQFYADAVPSWSIQFHRGAVLLFASTNHIGSTPTLIITGQIYAIAIHRTTLASLICALHLLAFTRPRLANACLFTAMPKRLLADPLQLNSAPSQCVSSQLASIAAHFLSLLFCASAHHGLSLLCRCVTLRPIAIPCLRLSHLGFSSASPFNAQLFHSLSTPVFSLAFQLASIPQHHAVLLRLSMPQRRHSPHNRCISPHNRRLSTQELCHRLSQQFSAAAYPLIAYTIRSNSLPWHIRSHLCRRFALRNFTRNACLSGHCNRRSSEPVAFFQRSFPSGSRYIGYRSPPILTSQSGQIYPRDVSSVRLTCHFLPHLSHTSTLAMFPPIGGILSAPLLL